MKLKFIAVETCPDSFVIEGEIVNGLDLSVFTEGSVFIGNGTTQEAGIYNLERCDGELSVTLGQTGLAYECQPLDGSHDWRGKDEWVDAADYDPEHCYIVATSAPEGAEHVQRDNGWTVTLPQAEEVEEHTV